MLAHISCYRYVMDPRSRLGHIVSVPQPGMYIRPISVLRFWISAGLTQAES